ncbi:type VII secretion-associated serine protease mycosin [Thermomonospora echinospora]|uniref:Type VII secretion-associated serine protease mycosin n=1 Tax=Thermomonospora echinospora TaxID=1992 RepID=A0A1H6D208_9ACTN|nr:S8 family serine peptidase [Thermomonospora echinospora]SEG79341.1 type VII secretion-associated serine protease mycosin [Thermomonospora echinospora]
MRTAGVAAGICVGLVAAVAVPPALASAPDAGTRPQAAPTASRTPSRSAEPNEPDDPGDRRPAPQVQCNPQQGFPAGQITEEPWPQRRLDFEQAWDLTKGAGVTVAVVDSGVAPGHPQYADRLVKSHTTVGTLTQDCNGHGTQVAGIIAAADHRRRNVPFLGVAPEVKLVSAKFTDGSSTSDNTQLPRAIRWAAEQGAQVINVSAAAPDTRALRDAVRFAQSKDALIVAAAGNVPDERKGTETPAYPASYRGVLSVAAADETGSISGFSNIKSRVDVAAPGQNVISTQPPRGYAAGLNGTSYGAPYAAGVAALVRSRFPKLTYQQVIRQIMATADGDIGLGSGRGMISPLRAVSEEVKPGQDLPRQGGQATPIPIAGVPPVDHRTRNLGLGIAGGAVGAALLLLFGGVVIPLGRRRGWRPGRASRPTDPNPGGA